MRTAALTREASTDEGTFGTLVTDTGKTFISGELPDRGNEHGTSCIPADTYICKWIDSPKHGECYQVTAVPGRDMIEMHSANFMGDTLKGKLSQLLGCIALGKSKGMLEGQMAVLASKAAIAEFEAEMGQEDFRLTIQEGA